MKHHTALRFLTLAIAASIALSACNKAPPASETTAPVSVTGNVSDIDVTEHVKTALRQNDSLKGFDIAVVTNKGDVRLIGILDSQAQIDEVIRIARGSDGVHAIHDELSIKK